MVLLINSEERGVKTRKSLVDRYMRLLVLLLLAPCSLLLASPAFAEEKVYKISIEGMHCKSCVYSVTKSLKRLKQVKDVEVNLKEGVAIVVLSDGKDVAARELEEAVKDSGYKPGRVEVAPSK